VARFATERAAAGDRVGLVLFGDTAFTASPLSSDGQLLAAALERVEAGVAGEATALGDALALAVKRVLVGAGSHGTAAGRVVVLLTDGRHNAGTLSVETATELARVARVRVHTVAIGSAGAAVPVSEAGRAGLGLERHDVDAATLAAIAAATDGRFFPARRADQLDAVYQDIDALERIPRTRPPRLRRSDRPEPLLALAGGFLLVELATSRVLRRRLP
jgi:Ca-activated chloride channel family protein